MDKLTFDEVHYFNLSSSEKYPVYLKGNSVFCKEQGVLESLISIYGKDDYKSVFDGQKPRYFPSSKNYVLYFHDEDDAKLFYDTVLD